MLLADIRNVNHNLIDRHMKPLFKLATLLGFTALFVLVVLPLGALARLLFDPLRLRRNDRAATYFQMHPMAGPRPAPATLNRTGSFAPRNS